MSSRSFGKGRPFNFLPPKLRIVRLHLALISMLLALLGPVNLGAITAASPAGEAQAAGSSLLQQRAATPARPNPDDGTHTGNGLAVTSMIVGIVAAGTLAAAIIFRDDVGYIVPFLSLVATVFASISLMRRQRGWLVRRGQALTGLVLGLVGLIGGVVLLIVRLAAF